MKTTLNDEISNDIVYVSDKSVNTDDKIYWSKPFNTDLLDLIDRNKLIWNDAICTMIGVIELQPLIAVHVKGKIKEIARGLMK
jgi:hypothetical protein